MVGALPAGPMVPVLEGEPVLPGAALPVPGPVPLALLLPLVVLPAGNVLLALPGALMPPVLAVSAGEEDIDEASVAVPVVAASVPLLPQPLSSALPSAITKEI